jgi:hypothetical protein
MELLCRRARLSPIVRNPRRTAAADRFLRQLGLKKPVVEIRAIGAARSISVW